MLRAFGISFRLRNTYKANSVIYMLKSIPLVKKLLPASLYASSGLKILANIIGCIVEFCSVFYGKALSLLLVYSMVSFMTAAPGDSFAHIMLFLTIIGGFMNTQIFNPTRDKYYAMCIMRMEPVAYTLANYLYFLLKMLVGFLPFSLLFGRLAGAPLLYCLALPILVVCVKLCFTALSLVQCKKQQSSVNENKLSSFLWVGVAVLLIAAFLPPYLGVAISSTICCYLTAALLLPALLSLRYIWRFDAYREIYKSLLTPNNMVLGSSKELAAASSQLAMQKKISMDQSQVSRKEGYPYFNELFMKRHSKLLTRSAKRITVVSLVLLAGAVASSYLFSGVKEVINELMLTFLPYFLFVMYMINRGKVITQAMFMNCDHSMLAYRFYRQPKAVLLLFVQRLKDIVLINLMPALVIAAGLPLLLFLTGGTDQPLNYVLLFVSILAMSVFFSVHNIVLYYLLQPYNVNLETKSPVYNIVNTVTYVVCYMAIGKEIPTLTFGTVITIFCVLYTLIAILLAYRLAPKTFKLRQ